MMFPVGAGGGGAGGGGAGGGGGGGEGGVGAGGEGGVGAGGWGAGGEGCGAGPPAIGGSASPPPPQADSQGALPSVAKAAITSLRRPRTPDALDAGAAVSGSGQSVGEFGVSGGLFMIEEC